MERCLPVLASPKRSFRVLTSAREKRDVLAKRNKTSRSRAACSPKERKVSTQTGRRCQHLRPSALTGPWPGGDSWSHWSLWLQLHPTPRDPDCPRSREQFPQAALRICEGEGTRGPGGGHGGRDYAETWSVCVSPASSAPTCSQTSLLRMPSLYQTLEMACHCHFKT